MTTTTAVRVHDAELSTDPDSIGTYAEAIAILTAVMALLGAAWFVAMPSQTADLVEPITPSPAVTQFLMSDGGPAIQPNVAASGPTRTEVITTETSLGEIALPNS